jgi:hypothetical protein
MSQVISQYPEVTETRTLKTVLDAKEITDASMENARLVREIGALEDAKKASASSYKARIEEKQARQGYLSGLVIEGWEDRQQKCYWIFETAGKDASGELIPHPENKTLIRQDTGEVVEVAKMTQNDFDSKELPLGDVAEGIDEEE